jgi:hypothetical protein
MKASIGIFCILGSMLAPGSIVTQTYPGAYPQTKLSNGVLDATIYLPDAEKGFYRGTRFDWAGVISSLEYKGHSYFGPFFEKFNSSVRDVVIGDPIEAGVNSAASGPVEEFIGADGSALGYVGAKPGEAFCKIGVGSLRKTDNASYSSYTNYSILDGGKRVVRSGLGWIEFTQQLHCGSGYGYSYTKTIRLLENTPEMTIEHRLVNTGEKPIETRVYDHNFLTIDHQSTGPDVVISFPFLPVPNKAMGRLARVRGNQLVFSKDLTGHDTFDQKFTGFGNTAIDYQIQIENHSTGAGVTIRGDRPLVNVEVWAVRTAVAPEPHVEIKVAAGREFTWKYTYRFYTVAGVKDVGK